MYSRENRIVPRAGQTYKNRTLKYIWPALNSSNFSNDVNNALNGLHKLAVGIADYNYNQGKDYGEDTLYVLFDINGRMKYNKYANIAASRKFFAQFLDRVKTEKSYVTDYAYDDVMLGHQHMVVFNLNIKDIVSKFIAGEYSKMYTPEQIDKWITKIKMINGTEYLTETYQILAKDPTYTRMFQKKIAEEFNTSVMVEQPMEYDFPPFLNEEIFNYV